MCGIVGGVTKSNITPLLIEGLHKLEYRGYDSSGLIVLSKENTFDRARSVGKVINLEKNLNKRRRKIREREGGSRDGNSDQEEVNDRGFERQERRCCDCDYGCGRAKDDTAEAHAKERANNARRF